MAGLMHTFNTYTIVAFNTYTIVAYTLAVFCTAHSPAFTPATPIILVTLAEQRITKLAVLLTRLNPDS